MKKKEKKSGRGVGGAIPLIYSIIYVQLYTLRKRTKKKSQIHRKLGMLLHHHRVIVCVISFFGKYRIRVLYKFHYIHKGIYFAI
jgi:hypothetical protein